MWDKKNYIYTHTLSNEFFLCCPSVSHGALCVVCGTLWKSNVSYKSSCQLEIASGLGVGAYVYFSFSALETVLFWTCTGAVQTATVAVSLCVCHTTMSGRWFSWESSITSSFYTLSTSPSTWFLWFDEDFPFRTECFKVSHSLHIFHLWDSWVLIYYRKKLLWWWLNKILIYNRSHFIAMIS